MFQTYTNEDLASRYLDKGEETSVAAAPVYNLCPTMDSPVLRLVNGKRRFDTMRWQLVPATEPAFTTRLSTINARSESIFQTRLYRDIVIRQRCIVPISGFFEWKREGSRTRPFRIQLKDEPIMSVAGIWETWKPGTPRERSSFSILTTAANETMRDIHDRMPVILGRADENEWLDPEIHEPQELQRLMKPCPGNWLETVEVSTLVNSSKNDTAAVLAPIQPADRKQQLDLFH